MTNLRVLIVAGDPLARAGMATLIAGEANCAVTGQVADNSDLNDAIQVYRPDILLWDLGAGPLPDLEQLAQVAGRERVVTLVAHEEDATRVLAAGVRGVLQRDADSTRIAAALRAASENLVALDPELASTLVPARSHLAAVPIDPLSPREQQVLELIAQGKPNKEIARQLGISEHTVKFHVNSILAKLHVQSRTEAVIQATRSGLVML